MSPEDQRHGSYAGYIAGDRCQDCRAAAAAYQRQRYFDRAVLGLPPRHVDKTGTVRRIHALQAIGWSGEELSLRIGKSRAYFNAAINRSERAWVYRSTADHARALYDELHETPGPSDITRKRAAESGWAPPAMWLDIDDPAETPDPGYSAPHWRAGDDFDEVTVDRLLGRDWSLARMTSRAEKVAVCVAWRARGESLAELERMTGWNVDRYLRAVREREAS